MHPSRLVPVTAVLFTAVLSAQQPKPQAAGFGAVYVDLSLDAITANVINLGVAADTNTGDFFVSATGVGGIPPHLIYHIDATGALVASFQQPSVHASSPFGIRDLAFDGQSLIGGSENGLSVFSTSGVPVDQIQAENGPQPIVQPITGPVAAQLSVFRAVALDKSGNGGDGSLLVADFGSPIYEIDFAGNILAVFPSQGWSAYGLAIDPVTGNPWVLADASGQIGELDRATMGPTGRRIRTVASGAPGGLAVAGSSAGHYEPWATEGALVHIVQGPQTTDRLGVQRLHLFPGLPGWDEVQLRSGLNGGPKGTGPVPFWLGDTLDYLAFDPTGQHNGQLAWIVFNVYFDANRNGYTNLDSVVPGVGILAEHRSLNVLSVPSTPNYHVLPTTIGASTSWSIPASIPLSDGDLFRMQAMYVEPASLQQGVMSTTEAVWQARAGERGIVVEANGVTSFNAGQAPPFWRVASDLTHGHGAITALEISTIGASSPASLQRFDIDQNSMNDRFDGGNATTPGFRGTYRNGSDLMCGLDYGVSGVYVAPFHSAGQSSGVSFSVPPDSSGYAQDLKFSFTAFDQGKAFEFDCDTDGGPPAGSDQAGMIVRVTTTGSGLLTGVMTVDPNVPNRALVWFP